MSRKGAMWVVAIVLVLVVAGGAATLYYRDAGRPGAAESVPVYQGRPATAWQRDLLQTDEAARAASAATLAAGKADAAPVCGWVLAHAAEAAARTRAADALLQMGPAAASAGPALIAALNDTDANIRMVAMRALGEIGPAEPQAVAALAAKFPDVEAIRAVAKFKSAGSAAVPKLLEYVMHPDPVVRWNAGRTLGRIGEPALPAVPALIEAMGSDPDPFVREHAAEAMGDIGPKAAPAVPALAKALADENARVRRDAVRSLGQIGPAAKDALPQVEGLKDDPDKNVREAAAKAARLIDPTRKGDRAR